MHVVVAGHVDHGKSTVIGRLLADTGSLPDGKLEQVRATCERTSQPFEYAFLLDALKDEQSQGITIDAARVFFRTPRRHYLIIDAPGHVEFLKNMITGASRAEAALLVLDAREGVQENSRRHGYLLALIGVRQVAVLVNKMDLVGHDRRAFEAVAGECADFLRRAGVRPAHVIPVCGRSGDNIAARSDVLSWYGGPTALEALEEFEPEPPAVDRPFRMPVQDVYKFTRQGDDRRIVAGTVASGTVKVGDEVVFYPSGKKSQVASIEAFNRPPPVEARAGSATGFTLREQIYVTRGEVATLGHQPRPSVTTRLRVSLFWLGRNALVPRRDYVLKLGTARVLARVETVLRVVDASSLDATPGKQRVDRHEVAECVKRAFPDGAVDRLTCCRLLKTDALTRTLSSEWPRYRFNPARRGYDVDPDREPFTGVIVGVRADEEGSRSKERYFSPRTRDNLRDVGDQPSEFWNQYKTEFAPGTHVRVHPLLDWTEFNIWEYITREGIPTVSLYYDQGDGMRYRSLGCWPCTRPVASPARCVDEIVEELRSGRFAQVAERAGRARDRDDGGGLETLRREGYM